MAGKREPDNVPMTPVGSFENSSGELIISDPCYEISYLEAKNQPRSRSISKARLGTWDASIILTEKDDRVSRLVAVARGFPVPDTRFDDPEFWISVDAAKAGIFDRAVFRNADTIPQDQQPSIFAMEDDPWFDMCCERTDGSRDDSAGRNAGIIPGGVVSCSGWGDGEYNVFCSRDNEDDAEEVTGVMIVFI